MFTIFGDLCTVLVFSAYMNISVFFCSTLEDASHLSSGRSRVHVVKRHKSQETQEDGCAMDEIEGTGARD